MKACLTDWCQIGKQTKSRTMYSWTEMRYRVNSKAIEGICFEAVRERGSNCRSRFQGRQFRSQDLRALQSNCWSLLFQFSNIVNKQLCLTVQTQLIWISFIEFWPHTSSRMCMLFCSGKTVVFDLKHAQLLGQIKRQFPLKSRDPWWLFGLLANQLLPNGQSLRILSDSITRLEET